MSAGETLDFVAWGGNNSNATTGFDATITTIVPEPTTLAIWGLGLGVAGAAALRRRKQRGGRWSEENRQAIFQVIGRNR